MLEEAYSLARKWARLFPSQIVWTMQTCQSCCRRFLCQSCCRRFVMRLINVANL